MGSGGYRGYRAQRLQLRGSASSTSRKRRLFHPELVLRNKLVTIVPQCIYGRWSCHALYGSIAIDYLRIGRVDNNSNTTVDSCWNIARQHSVNFERIVLEGRKDIGTGFVSCHRKKRIPNPLPRRHSTYWRLDPTKPVCGYDEQWPRMHGNHLYCHSCWCCDISGRPFCCLHWFGVLARKWFQPILHPGCQNWRMYTTTPHMGGPPNEAQENSQWSLRWKI